MKYLFFSSLLFFLLCYSFILPFDDLSGEHKTLSIGSHAPDFNLLGVDGKMYSLASFKNANILVVVFTCDHCPTAQAYEDRIIKLTKDYEPRGAAVVAIMPNDPKSVQLNELGYSDLGDTYREMKIRVEERHFNFPYKAGLPAQEYIDQEWWGKFF